MNVKPAQMDAETLKAVISFISAVVAVIGAGLAHKARIQTRMDMFESQRDALILSMTDNDNRCSDLKLRAVRSKAMVEQALENIHSAEDKATAEGLLRSLKEIEGISEMPMLRQYTPNSLDELHYSEEALTIVRKVTRGEMVISKHLQATNYDLVFEEIRSLVSKSESNI